ncbi:MAG: DNA cytosine methyltransferase [Bacteroides sp.]|nr:DNA cytosine methyltransferase [Bacteroides sp.]MBD5361846.1 DNA cytosine methyltransferase [Bacteroides sp.]MBD5371948.1 DNA cytosine methyltransferase [Bacteroides sp.]
MTEPILNTLDLFAGCGGLTEGFLQSGHYHTVGAVEWEKAPYETIKHRLLTKWKHPNSEDSILRFDIQRTEELLYGYDDPEYGKHRGLNEVIGNTKIDVIIGGPPCQAYSLAGRIRDEHGMKNDYRNYLFERYIEIVKHLKPKFFVFENVIGLLSAAPDGTLITTKIYKAFREAGYLVTPNFRDALFDVADYGIPQHRKRVIILGISEEEFGDKCDVMLNDFYKIILPSLKGKRRTVKDAISDLPALYPLEEPIINRASKMSHLQHEGGFFMNHTPRFHSLRDIGVFRLLAEDIQSGKCEYVSIEKLKELYTKVTGKKSNIHKYYVLRKDEPSNTIPAHLYKDGMRHIHPDPLQARSITPREAARLQTFPDDFEFLGASMAQYKMIGNAVPVDFAKIIAQALYKLYLSDYNHGRIFH